MEPLNHHTIVRINNEGIKRNYERFMREILQGPPANKLTEAMFMRPDHLHIKLNMMSIKNENALAHATSQLESVIREDENPFGQLKLWFSGVNLYNSRPPTLIDRNGNKCVLLYGRIESNSLRHIANVIQQHFPAAGHSKQYQVDMHIPLISTNDEKWRQTLEEWSGNYRTPVMGYRSRYHNNRKKAFFDANAILEKYCEHDFGSQVVTEILLSSRSEKDSDGFYKTIASVKI